jgi:hypothetical protein
LSIAAEEKFAVGEFHISTGSITAFCYLFKLFVNKSKRSKPHERHRMKKNPVNLVHPVKTYRVCKFGEAKQK